MKKCIIIGKTNVGKTLFTINFANYLGSKILEFVFDYHDNGQIVKKYSLEKAKKELTSINPHKTLCLQKININIPVGKGKKQLEIIDTSGLIDGIHKEENVRKAISHTLAAIRHSHLILHMVDASAVIKKDTISSLGEIDYQIAQFCQLKPGYAILANKMDLPFSDIGFKRLKEEFPGNLIIPISALNQQGFKEVIRFVKRNL
ncbi:MAG: hypothetical protein PWQ82_1388 [Thermosediminibacterales bacterium]|nr:hypothetical protein [Thermosediminibacterales bacterium]